MENRELKSNLVVYNSVDELTGADAKLVEIAKGVLDNSYSPYSNFKVAAAVLLENGETLTGTNQENAAFPVGICAEGTVLSTASSLYPNIPISKIAITVKSPHYKANHPVAPCGICRQRLLEYENRFKANIEIIMTGEEGEVFSVKSVKDILPLSFSGADL